MFLFTSYMFYCEGASKTGNPLPVCGEILQTILVKNASDIFKIKSVVSYLMPIVHVILCLYKSFADFFTFSHLKENNLTLLYNVVSRSCVDIENR